MATTIPTLNSKLWTEFDGKGFSAKHAEYAERASTDVMGHDLTLTMTNNQVTAIGGKPISAVAPAEMTGATVSTDGESGLVPAPEAGDQDKYLKGDGTWANVPVAVASTSGAGGTDGLMPATDKEKLDGAKSFSTVKVTNGNVSATLPATSLNEEIELVAGDNVTLEAGLVIGGHDSTFPNKVRISSDAALEKSTYGTYVSSEQGEAVQGESGEISVSENSVELYDTFKGVKFGAARAVADREGNVIDETYATREGATSSEAGLMSAADKSKLDGITDYVVSAAVSGSTLTLTPKTGSAVVFTDTGEANVIESVKLGNDTLTPASKVVTIPLFDSTTNGAVTAPAAANRNHYSFLDGMGDWSMLEEVSEAAINGMFLKVTIDGREYKVVRIGNQEWLAENLDYKFEVNGSPIELNSQSMSTPSTPAAWYYNRNAATYGVDGEYKCGLLYNGFAARYLEANKNNLLPNGWHIPTTAEWNTLATACGGASVAGKKLKALNNSITSNWPSNWNGTDDYGFDSIPVGLVQDMTFQLFGTKNHIWSSTEIANQYNDMVTLSSGSDDMYITYYSIYTAMSIRLVKDIT